MYMWEKASSLYSELRDYQNCLGWRFRLSYSSEYTASIKTEISLSSNIYCSNVTAEELRTFIIWEVQLFPCEFTFFVSPAQAFSVSPSLSLILLVSLFLSFPVSQLSLLLLILSFYNSRSEDINLSHYICWHEVFDLFVTALIR